MREAREVGWLIALLVLAAIVFGIWLWGRLVDGATEIAVAAMFWPFAKLFGVSATNHAVTVLRTPQRFQLAASPEQVGQVLTSVPGFASGPFDGRPAPFYRDVQPGRIIIGVGNTQACHYDIEIQFVDGWPGTCGELLFLTWKHDPIDEMSIHHDLLDAVFQSLKSLDAELYVTTGALTPAQVGSGPPLPAPIGPTPTDPPPPIRLGPAWPTQRTVSITGMAHSIPLIPVVATVILIIALIVGISSATGVFHTTTRSELCSAYSTAVAQFAPSSITNDEELDKAMDDVDMSDELNALKDRADSYDDKGVQGDAANIEGLGTFFSESNFDSATAHIAAIC